MQQNETAEELKFVSMADMLAEDSEFEGYRPDADANAGLPPLPKGDYLCIVRYRETDPTKRWPSGKEKDTNGQLVQNGKLPTTKDGKKFAYTEVEIETNGNADPAHDGRRFTGMVNTLVMRASGTTSIQALLQGCGVESGELQEANSIKGQVALLDKYLNDGNTIGGVHLDWEANLYKKDMLNTETGKMGLELFRLKGMKKFPPAKDAEGNAIPGVFEPVYSYKGMVGETPIEEDLTARNFIHHWVSLDKLAGVGMEPEQVPVAQTPAPAASVPVASKAVAGGPPVPASAIAGVGAMAGRRVAGRR